MSTNALFALQEMYPPPHMILMYPPPHINDVHQRSICTTTLVAVSPATHGSAGLFPQETRHAAQLGALCFSLLLSSLLISSLCCTHAPQLLHASPPTRALSHTQDAPRCTVASRTTQTQDTHLNVHERGSVGGLNTHTHSLSSLSLSLSLSPSLSLSRERARSLGNGQSTLSHSLSHSLARSLARSRSRQRLKRK